ncbi:SapC family protein [Exilibacterium tricleocarpae]|uniref:SapC family protein n=1 Tax=Exilibacterium tricleocarpae TaxID=2591008 RepID=A0A545SLV9_9GAMM|nr:SapC family protein [Exilibacterium tricleocarpae]TQV65963.1 SapC family protein [Exilibacterium tricleocarpae]
MANHALLNNVDHQHLRVITRHGVEWGDNQMCTLAIPSEFRSLQADYPIFFHCSGETDKFMPMVMFGFEQGENLYLSEQGWDASYIPLMIQRGPFLIGFQQRPGEQRSQVMSIDLDDPHISTTEGEALFLPHGGNTPYTERMASVLQAIDQGQAAVKAFTDALVSQQLLEPFTLNVTLNNGAKLGLDGFHTIHEERLAELDGEVLIDFHRRGILQAIYMVLASMSNIRRLIDKRNARL